MFASKIARFAVDRATEALLVLFPPTPLPLARPRTIKQVPRRAITKRVSLEAITQKTIAIGEVQIPAATRAVVVAPSSTPIPAKPRSSTPRRRVVVTRTELVKRNSCALTLEQPVKSCFRQCRANEAFGLPSSLSSPRPRRRIVFAEQIDDGGNYPRHQPLPRKTEREELEEVIRRFEIDEDELEVLVFSPSAPPRRPSTLPPRARSTPRKFTSPVPPTRTPPRKVASLQAERPSLPSHQSRLRTPPLPGQTPTRRVVAYSFHH
ncbi:uncharacterized protein JCM6883_005197 [Sporobolomyces salmoneus]|uniref:uncharacterized protein n=1 Tax=Sporobolomyces salmoneus TaxID=183962 RepID=UPI00316CD49C